LRVWLGSRSLCRAATRWVVRPFRKDRTAGPAATRL